MIQMKTFVIRKPTPEKIVTNSEIVEQSIDIEIFRFDH